MSTLQSSFSLEALRMLRSQLPPQYAFLLAEWPEESGVGAGPKDDRGATHSAATAVLVRSEENE